MSSYLVLQKAKQGEIGKKILIASIFHVGNFFSATNVFSVLC